MNMRVSRSKQAPDVFAELVQIGVPRHGFERLGIKALKPGFQLKQAARRVFEKRKRRRRKLVGGNLKMKADRRLVRIVFKNEAKNLVGSFFVGVKRAVNEFDRLYTAAPKKKDRALDKFHRKRPHAAARARQAERAGKRAAARRFHIRDPSGQLCQIVRRIGTCKLG